MGRQFNVVVYRYTVETDTWQTMNPYPKTDISAATCFTLDNPMFKTILAPFYCAGGFNQQYSGSPTLTAIYQYHPLNDSWTLANNDLPATYSAMQSVVPYNF